MAEEAIEPVSTSSETLDINTKRVVGEAVLMCREKGYKVDITIAAFVARSQDMQRSYNPPPEGGPPPLDRPDLSEDDVRHMGRLVAEALLVPDSPFLATARMQLQMEDVFQRQKRLVEEELNQREDTLDSIVQGMHHIRVTPDSSLKELGPVFDAAFAYCCHRAGLGHALGDDEMKAEVFAAFESVFPQYLMPRFVGMSEEDQVGQMEEVSAVVLGVCAYNAQTGQAGVTLAKEFSVVGYAQQAARLKRDVHERVRQLEESIEAYVKTLNHQGQKLPPDSPGMARLRDELTHLQQELAYALQLEEDIMGALEAVQQTDIDARALLREAHSLVERHRTAVPKDQVFPIFDRVGGLYLQLSDERKMLTIRQRLFEALAALRGGFAPRLTPGMVKEATAAGTRALAASVVPLEGSRPDASVKEDPTGVNFVAADSVGPEQKVELGGYCPIALCRRGGLLIPAATDLGFAEVNGRLYGCSSRAHLQDFANFHDFYVGKLEEVVSGHPELVKLIGMTDLFPSLALSPLVTLMASGLKCEFGTQTPTHFVEKRVDVNYDWNVWSLRRKALRLANLRQCKTHSAQTALSHFRRENETQTWVPKAAGTQTASNKGQTMPKKMQYVAGIRGSAKSRLKVVRLELDLGQPHEF